jgi:hypothetical protein
MLINLVPDFLATTLASDPLATHEAYFREHEALLRAYWHNYVLEPEGAPFRDLVRSTLAAPRDDLIALLARTDIVGLAREAEARARELLDPDVDFDVVLLVGVGAANAGELVVNGRGVAFVCLEHFTGFANHQTHALGLEPELILPWLVHEITHVVRYTSPTSRSELKRAIADAGGNYSCWESARHASLRELLVNEGVAVQASRLASPGHAPWEYFGYGRREFARIRELEPALAQAAAGSLDQAALGLRLRFLAGGASTAVRTVDRLTLPERSGYYLGARMVEAAIERHGLAWAVRASAEELDSVTIRAAQIA